MKGKIYSAAIFFSFYLTVYAQDNNGAANNATECLAEKKSALGMSQDANREYVIDELHIGGNNQVACTQECCDRIQDCNVAVFERTREGDYICTLLRCEPFNACEWQSKISSSVVVLVPEKPTHAEQVIQQLEDQLLNTNDTDWSITTPNIIALVQEEIQEVDDEFLNAFNNIDWNIDENATDPNPDLPLDESTTSDWLNWFNDMTSTNSLNTWYDFESTTTGNSDYGYGYDDADWDNWVEDSSEDVDSDDSLFDSGEWSGESSEPSENEQEGNADTDDNDYINDEPAISHVNDAHNANIGMYGPSSVDEPNVAPLIVMGVVATVVFILMVLIFVARKLSREQERLKYRPLNESFPSNTTYHDNENAFYHDVKE